MTKDQQALIDAVEALQKEYRNHIKMDVKKHYSLMVADAHVSKLIHQMRGQNEADKASEQSDVIPVTPAFLALIRALHGGRNMFVSECQMATELNMLAPPSWESRCRTLFFSTYAAHVEELGLRCNEATYQSLMDLEVPQEVWFTSDAEELSRSFVFDLAYVHGDGFAGTHQGGIRKIV